MFLKVLLFSFAFIASVHAQDTQHKLLEDFKRSFKSEGLTVPIIIGLGASKGSSIKNVQAEYALIESPYLEFSGNFTTQLKFTAAHQENEYDPIQPSFNPIRYEATSYETEVSRAFTTGSLLQFSLTQKDYDPTYASSAVLSATLPAYNEAIASVKLTQSLWKNSFGYSSRQLKKAARLSSEAQAHKAEVVSNEWFLNITQQLYSAWASQKATEASIETYQRRQELLKIVRINKNRGTANTKDFLQLKAAATSAEIEFRNAKDQLQSLWDQLIIRFALPNEWRAIDPLKIPMILDQPVDEALQICKSPATEAESVKSLQKSASAASLREKAMRNQINPELNLFGTYSGNEISGTPSSSLSGAGNFENPEWTIGVEFKMPFAFDAEKAEALKAYSQKLVTEAQMISEQDKFIIEQSNGCRNLNLLAENLKNSHEILKDLKSRENLEYKDFRIGRTSSFAYIQAGDDVTQANLKLINDEVQIRKIAWSIIARNKNLKDRIQQFVEKLR